MAVLRETQTSLRFCGRRRKQEKTLAGIETVEARASPRWAHALHPTSLLRQTQPDVASTSQAKRCIESDRPVDDFSALWEQMRLKPRRGGGPRYQLQASRDGARRRHARLPVYRGRTPSAVSPPASSTRGELTSSIREPQVRAEQEREYMQKQGTYLNGLQSHMLGDLRA